MRRFVAKSVILILIIGAAHYALLPALILDDALYYQEYKLRRMNRGENFKVIVLGDSRAQAMSSKAPGFYNYATSYYGGVFPYISLLKRYLAHNQPPQAILLSIVPETLCEPRDFEWTPRAVRVLTFSELLRPENGERTARRLWEMVSWKYFYNNKWGQRVEKEKYDKSTGFLVYSRFISHVVDPAATYVDTPGAVYKPHRRSTENLDAFFHLAGANGIRVTLYVMPVPEEVYRKHQAFFDAFSRDIRRYPLQYSNVSVIPPYSSLDRYPARYFSDGKHLNLPGADVFNAQRFPDILRQTLNGRSSNKRG